MKTILLLILTAASLTSVAQFQKPQKLTEAQTKWALNLLMNKNPKIKLDGNLKTVNSWIAENMVSSFDQKSGLGYLTVINNICSPAGFGNVYKCVLQMNNSDRVYSKIDQSYNQAEGGTESTVIINYTIDSIKKIVTSVTVDAAG